MKVIYVYEDIPYCNRTDQACTKECSKKEDEPCKNRIRIKEMEHDN